MIMLLKRVLLGSGFLGVVLLLSACGSGSNTSATTSLGSNQTTSTSCTSSDYVYSSTYGTCLQQTSTCYGSYAIYNSSCVLISGTTSTTTTTHTPYQGSCSANLVQTAAGCLSQGVCASGYGWNGISNPQGAWCYPATATY